MAIVALIQLPDQARWACKLRVKPPLVHRQYTFNGQILEAFAVNLSDLPRSKREQFDEKPLYSIEI